MTTRTIQSRLSRASIPFSVLRGAWFREDGGEMGEYLSGIVVDSREDYLRAAVALGVGESVALGKLRSWSCFHLPDLEGYPISVSFETHFDRGDGEPTDSGSFSLTSPQ